MKARSGGDTGSADIAGVGGDFRLVQDDMHAGLLFWCITVYCYISN